MREARRRWKELLLVAGVTIAMAAALPFLAAIGLALRMLFVATLPILTILVLCPRFRRWVDRPADDSDSCDEGAPH
jgi:membrane protein implicated in regulation of membrane protease activity